MIPTKEQRDEWRKLAENTMMDSAIGEYTPGEFIVLLDAVDELEARTRRTTTAGIILYCPQCNEKMAMAKIDIGPGRTVGGFKWTAHLKAIWQGAINDQKTD